MKRIFGIILLTALNIITSLATIGLLILLWGLGDIASDEIIQMGIGSIVFLIIYTVIEIIKWVVYIFILMKRREKLKNYLIVYGAIVVFVSLFFKFIIPIFIGLLYLLVVYLLKEEKVTTANDYLLFDEKPEDIKVESSPDLPFIIGLTLLVIVSFYMTWTTMEATMSVISYDLNLGVVPLVHLILNVLLSILCWISLYSVINNRKSKWKYYFAVFLVVDMAILIWRTIELSKLDYFTSAFMLLDPGRVFMIAFNIIGLLLLIRKPNVVNEEEVDL